MRLPFKIYLKACNHKYHVYHDERFLYLTDDETIKDKSDIFTIDALGHLIPLDKPDKCIMPITNEGRLGYRLMLYDLKNENRLDDEANSDKAVRTITEGFDLPVKEHDMDVNDVAKLNNYIKEFETHPQTKEMRNKGFSITKWCYGGGFITLRFYPEVNSAIGLCFTDRLPNTDNEIEEHIIKSDGILTLNTTPEFMKKAPNCFRFEIVVWGDELKLQKESFNENRQSDVISVLVFVIIVIIVVMYYVYRQCFKKPVIGFNSSNDE